MLQPKRCEEKLLAREEQGKEKANKERHELNEKFGGRVEKCSEKNCV